MSDLSQEQRDKLPESDFGDPEGRKFPILDQDDVDSAAHLIGKAGDPEAVKRRIIAIAKRKGLTVPDAWQAGGGKSDGDMLVAYAGAVKAMGGGRIRVPLVRFSHEEDHDTDGEYFHEETDFDTDFPVKRSLWYHHGQDEEIGDRRLGRVEIKQSKADLWFDHQLNMADEYESKMYRLAELGKLGASSGALPHLVKRVPTGKAVRIDRWPLAEASILVTPADPCLRAVALKSWKATPIDEALALAPLPVSLAEDLERAADHIESIRGRCAGIAGKSGRKLSATRRERLARLRDELTALLDETAPEGAAASRSGELPDDAEQSALDIAETETLMLAFQAQANGVSLTAGAPL